MVEVQKGTACLKKKIINIGPHTHIYLATIMIRLLSCTCLLSGALEFEDCEYENKIRFVCKFILFDQRSALTHAVVKNGSALSVSRTRRIFVDSAVYREIPMF